MKKSLKLAVLLLSLALIFGALMVVSFAADGETELAPPKVVNTQNFEGSELGAELGNAANKIGKWEVVQADNGNKYAATSYTTATGTGAQNYDFGLSASASYNLQNYPTFALDFDVRSVNGNWNYAATIRADLNGALAIYDRLQMLDSNKFSTIGLPSTPDVWNHVTIIIDYVGNGVFETTFYVNGVRTNQTPVVKDLTKTWSTQSNANKVFSSWNDLLDENGELKYENIRVNYISIYTSKAEADHLHFDNFTASYYPEGYDLDTVAAYHYNENYEMPYSYTVAKIGDVCYDDADEAIAAVKEGETLTLMADYNGYIRVDQPMSIDANVYGTDGEPTGSYYNFNWGSTKGYVVTSEAGIHTFKLSDKRVTVKWDPACSEACDHYADFGGHALTSESIVAYGYVPVYLNDMPEFAVVNGLKKEFLGWSYENDGTADELYAINDAQAEAGEVVLYPVYKATQYDFELVKGNVSTYHFENEFDAQMKAITTATTVILHNDITMYHTINNKGVSVTLDLNGFTLKRHYATITTYNAVYDAESDTYVKTGDATGKIIEGADTVNITSYGNGATLVYGNCVVAINTATNTPEMTFKITSSRPGAVIDTITITADRLFVDGEAVKTENVMQAGATGLFFLSPAGNSKTHIVLDTKNVTVYSDTIISAEHGSNGKEDITIDGGTFYGVGSLSEGMFALRRGEQVSISNATFYARADKDFVRNQGGKEADYKKGTKITFTNCNIYDPRLSSRWEDTYVFNNCRIVNPVYVTNPYVVFGEDTLVTGFYENVHIDPSLVYASEREATTYSYSNIYGYRAVYADGKYTVEPIFNPAVIEGSYTYAVRTPQKLDESVKPNISILYYTDFEIAMYIPVYEGREIVSVSGFTQNEKTVKIDGVEYLVYKMTVYTATASDDVLVTVDYTVDGGKYRQWFTVGALVYAENLLATSEDALEKAAVANMVRYIKEARIVKGLEVSDKFDKLIALGNVSELGNAASYADDSVNYEALSEYIDSIGLMADRNFAAYVITLSDAAKAAGAEITVKYVGSDANLSLKDSQNIAGAKITNKTKMYDIAKDIEITVTVGGEVVATGTYSAGAYISATDNTFAKAMYEFGQSVAAYRAQLAGK